MPAINVFDRVMKIIADESIVTINYTVISRVPLIPARVAGKLAQHAELICVHQLTHPDFDL